jgi:peptidoglycan/xylan/chitin deacetylase (PgdA/CDA1 family)
MGIKDRRAARSSLVTLLLVLGWVLSSRYPVLARWEEPHVVDIDDGARQHSAESIALPASVRVPILMYHYVSELPPDADRYRKDLTVLPGEFRSHLQYLADAGYHTITLTDLYLHLNHGYPLPSKPVVLTFDDGYRDAYEVVFPLLLEYGFTGTFFVLATPTHQESDDYLTWAQMKEMADAGMEIQSHGRDHVDLRGRSYDYLVYQILGIQEAIGYHTGQVPRFFCYPSGRYDDDVISVLKAAGYWGAVTTQWGRTISSEGLYEMPRLRIKIGRAHV